MQLCSIPPKKQPHFAVDINHSHTSGLNFSNSVSNSSSDINHSATSSLVGQSLLQVKSEPLEKSIEANRKEQQQSGE